MKSDSGLPPSEPESAMFNGQNGYLSFESPWLKRRLLNFLEIPVVAVKMPEKRPLLPWSRWADAPQSPEERAEVLKLCEEVGGYGFICPDYPIDLHIADDMILEKVYLFVIDLDGINEDDLRRYFARGMPITYTEGTPRGAHLYFVTKIKPPTLMFKGRDRETGAEVRIELRGARSMTIGFPTPGYRPLNDNLPRFVDNSMAVFHEIVRIITGVDFQKLAEETAEREAERIIEYADAEREYLGTWLKLIVDELDRRGLIKHFGPKYVSCLCPFHPERHPSFALNLIKFYAVDYHDFDEQGRPRIYNLKQLAERLGIELPKPVPKEGTEKSGAIALKVEGGADESRPLKVVPLRQLVEEAEPITWLVDGLIPAQGLVVLAGKAGAGKSFLSLTLAHAVANGESSFLGALPVVEKGPVLIIDNENYPGLYKDRVKALGFSSLEGIDVINLQDLAIDRASDVERLAQLIREKGYRLVVLDSWTNLITRTDENKAHEVGPVLSRLRRISHENKCTFMLIHHLRKNVPYAVELKDELRGSVAFVNEADLVLLLQNGRERRLLTTVKNRYGAPLALELSFKANGDRLTIEGSRVALSDAELESQLMRALDAIIQYIRAKGAPATAGELINELPFAQATIKRALNLGLSLRKIERIKRGLYALPQTLDTLLNPEDPKPE